MTNPYYNDLFNIMSEYVSEGGKIADGVKLEKINNTSTLSVFESSTASASSLINIAGNYKYSCIVPMDAAYPPNYVGVLQENGMLTSGDLIYELLTFTDAKNRTDVPKINCNSLVARTYDKLFRNPTKDGNVDSDTHMINFTNGLPYSLYKPGLRSIHKDITKRINKVIDYAIRTGQDEKTETYSKELVKLFHDIFFTWDGDRDYQIKAIPRYYDLRTGLLPTAISFAKWKALNVGDKMVSLSECANKYLDDVDQLRKGMMFIPGGISEQFDTTNNERPLFWYPFNIDRPYSYRFNYGDSKTQTTADQKYKVIKGFNHYDITNNDKLKTMLFNVPADTAELNSIFTKSENDVTISLSPMILSYGSSLSTVPAPKTVTIVPMVDQFMNTNDSSTCLKRGEQSNAIVAINDADKNSIWANPTNSEDKIIMHPLLNRKGKDDYLNIATEKHPSYITDNTFETASEIVEETHYYNDKFTFNLEERMIDRLNYYFECINNSDSKISEDVKEKSCIPTRLEFAKISNKQFNVVDNNKLMVDDTVYVENEAFGVISKKTTSSWKTKSIGICEIKNAAITPENQDAYKENGLFTTTIAGTNSVPKIDMPIRALHYMDPVAPLKGGWDQGMSCPYREDDIGFFDSMVKSCRLVPHLRNGLKVDPLEWNDNDSKSMEIGEWKDHEEVNITVAPNINEAVLGTYNQQALHSICKAVLDGGRISEYYYTIHILSDDGDINNKFGTIDATGEPDFTGKLKEDMKAGATEIDIETLKQRYGTGLQYFFAGVCDKNIYDSYFNKGLTVHQLLDYTSSIDGSGKDENGNLVITLSRVSGGLRRAYITFEWDYDVILKAWQLALWIMRGMSDAEDKSAHDGKKIEYWNMHNAPLALAAFFDYIYSNAHQGNKLMLGPSLKQINNLVGPYGSTWDKKGNSGGEDTALNTPMGAALKNIREHRDKVAAGQTYESKKAVRVFKERLKYGDGDIYYGNRYTNSTDHTLISSHIFVDKNLPIYGGANSIEEYKVMGANGVGRNYWGKGEGGKNDESPWGMHTALTYYSAVNDSYVNRGKLKLDHYSWDWNISHNAHDVSPTSNNERWKGAFMIHSLGEEGGKFNWHLGPFHTVSEEGQKHTNEYGTRQGLSKWAEWKHDVKDKKRCKKCMDTQQIVPSQPNRMSWRGINGETHGNQNPNIRVRLPMLWRYLKALRAHGIYTDGQLMPCGVELHYNEASKSVITSIKNAELTVPMLSGNEDATANTWLNVIRNPSSTVFAEVLYDTYAVSKATIDKWKNIMFDKANTHNMIRDILTTVAKQKPKIVALNRAKTYIDSLRENNVELKDGKTVFNLPVLPVIASFGTKIPGEGERMDTSITNTEDPLTTIGSSLPNIYKQCPSVDFSAVVPVKSVGIGVTDTPVLNPGVEPNQFTAISNALYNDVLSFDGNTFGWLIPIPHASNLALLNAYDDTWRQGQPSVIPLKLNNDEYKSTISHLANKSLHWIGWFVEDYRDKLEENDIKSSVHICDDDTNMADNAVIRTSMLKITPQWYNTDKPANSNQNPFAVKLEIDTRSDGGVRMIMIRDTIPETDTVKIEYEINNVSVNVKLPNTTNTIVSNITNVTYDREMFANGAIAPL